MKILKIFIPQRSLLTGKLYKRSKLSFSAYKSCRKCPTLYQFSTRILPPRGPMSPQTWTKGNRPHFIRTLKFKTAKTYITRRLFQLWINFKNVELKSYQLNWAKSPNTLRTHLAQNIRKLSSGPVVCQLSIQWLIWYTIR